MNQFFFQIYLKQIPVSASQISAWLLQLQGIQRAKGPPFGGSWWNPGAQDSQNWPT